MKRVFTATACLLAMILGSAAEHSTGFFASGWAHAQVLAEQAVGAQAVSRPATPAITPPARLAFPSGRAATPGPPKPVLPGVVLPRGWHPVELRYGEAGCMAYCFHTAGELMVPLWSLRALGATAGWDDAGRLIVALGRRSVFLKPGVPSFLIRTREGVMGDTWWAVPRRVHGDLFVPLREIARALGLEIAQDGLALRLVPGRVTIRGG